MSRSLKKGPYVDEKLFRKVFQQTTGRPSSLKHT